MPSRIVLGIILNCRGGVAVFGHSAPGWTPSLATSPDLRLFHLIGLNLIFGVTGMLALGQAAFMALPGYVSGNFGRTNNVPGALSIPLGIAAAVGIARLVAEIFVRLPGIYFAIGRWGLPLLSKASPVHSHPSPEARRDWCSYLR